MAFDLDLLCRALVLALVDLCLTLVACEPSDGATGETGNGVTPTDSTASAPGAPAQATAVLVTPTTPGQQSQVAVARFLKGA
ncbi:MAG: hypothetical protein ABIO17_11830 [Pseudoxanthomonas sp.]